MEKSLHQLYIEHHGKSSDKWSIYFEEYERAVGHLRNEAVNLLEIGVQNGGSLELWLKYFNKIEKIVGCDINPKCNGLMYEDNRINLIVADANQNLAESQIKSISKGYNIIIDDGSHTTTDIIKTFNRYFPYLIDNGVYIIEDLHCSYWQDFDGGLFDSFSSLSFFKKLIDVINYEHWGNEISIGQFLIDFEKKYGLSLNKDMLEHIHSIEFINSMCVIRKNKKEKNILGNRVIVGDIFDVVQSKSENGKALVTPDQSLNPWANQTEFYNHELNSLKLDLSKKNQQIIVQDDFIKTVLSSRSWRLTAPLRFLSSLINKMI